MKKKEDRETRYYIDLDLRTRRILNWNYDQRDKLVQKLKNPFHQRVFITKGQYNKLEERRQRLRSGAAIGAGWDRHNKLEERRQRLRSGVAIGAGWDLQRRRRNPQSENSETPDESS